MTNGSFSIILLCAAVSTALGQGGGRLPSFEVASVKPVPTAPSGRHLCWPVDPIHYRCTNATVAIMAYQAYDLKSYQFPSSSDYSAEYDVEARVPEGATPEQVKLMLRNLLAERFKMASHFERKEMPVYELKVAPGGVKFKEAAADVPDAPRPAFVPDSQLRKDSDGFPIRPRQPGSMRIDRADGLGHVVGWGISLSSLVNYLSQRFKMPVLDSTDMQGKYDYAVTFSLASVNEGITRAGPPGEASEPVGGGGPSIFTALERQLGLKLQKAKGMIDIFVIDHVEKTPTPD